MSNTQLLNTRRKVIIITLLIYVAIWTFLFDAAHTIPNEEVDPPFVLGLLFLSVGTFFIYLITYLVFFFQKQDSGREDYLLALIVILIPVIIVFVDYKLTSV